MRHLRGQVAVAQRLHRRDNGPDSSGNVANQQDRSANSQDNCHQQRRQDHLDGIVKTLLGLAACRIRALVVQQDVLLQRLVGMDAGKRRLGMEQPRLLVLILAGQHQNLLYAGEIFGPGGAELVVQRALLGRGDQRFISFSGVVGVVDPLGEQILLNLPRGLVGRQQMGAHDRPVGDGHSPQFAENANARQPIGRDVDGGGIDRIHLPDVQRAH